MEIQASPQSGRRAILFIPGRLRPRLKLCEQPTRRNRVYKFAQTREKDSPLNIQACEYFMGDLAAVVRGLRDGGADEIVVLDGHGTQCIIPHLMEPGAKCWSRMP
ncbi:MAG: M55 family metallopeptidase [Bacteroidales bacterium]|nr:M55 family metallopeptidase [Bacteroidales bacterium]